MENISTFRDETLHEIYSTGIVLYVPDSPNTPIQENQERFRELVAQTIKKDVVSKDEIIRYLGNLEKIIGFKEVRHFLSHIVYFDAESFYRSKNYRGRDGQDIAHDQIISLADSHDHVPSRAIESRIQTLCSEMFSK